MRERGYTPDEVLALRATRERDAARFIAVQRPLADLVVRFHNLPDGISAELLLRRHGDHDSLAPALEALSAAPRPGLVLERAITDDDGHRVDRLVIDPTIAPESAAAAATLIGAGLPGIGPAVLNLLGQVRLPNQALHNLPLALTQLLIVRRMLAVSGAK